MFSTNEKGRKESRINLHKALQPTKVTVKLLLQDWLTTSQKGMVHLPFDYILF